MSLESVSDFLLFLSFLWVMCLSLCVQSECALVFLVPDHSLHTVHVAQILSPEVWAQQLSVTNFCLRVIGQRGWRQRRP